MLRNGARVLHFEAVHVLGHGAKSFTGAPKIYVQTSASAREPDTVNESERGLNIHSVMQILGHARTANLFSSLSTCGVTSARLAVVIHVAHIRHVDVFSFLFPDDKSHFNVAFWTLAFRASSEEHC